MPELTLAEITQKSRDEQAMRILNAAGDQRYRKAFNAVGNLKLTGWLVEVWDAREDVHVTVHGPKVGPHLCVTFTAPGDCECTGR
jgi:hypothetical protein